MHGVRQRSTEGGRRGSRLAKLLKYAAVGKVTIRNHLAYVTDFFIRSIFLIIILYIFIQLWNTTFRGEGTELIAGYSFEQIIWYLIFAESFVIACPSLSTKIEEEVKSGDIGYKLARPVSYLWFHYAGYMSEVFIRMPINLAVGGMLGILVLGPPGFGWGWPGFLLVSVGAFTINFLLNMMLALCAFWVEETRGLEFVYHKFLFTVGGMLMPLELFPQVLQKVCAWLPFQAIVYFAARTAVSFDAEAMWRMLGTQAFWIAGLGAALMFIYRKGVSKLHVNGG